LTFSKNTALKHLSTSRNVHVKMKKKLRMSIILNLISFIKYIKKTMK